VEERPITITLVGTLLLVIGFLSLYQGYLAIQEGSALGEIDPQALGIFSAVVGLFVMISALATFTGMRYSWFFVAVVCVVAMVNAALFFPDGLVRIVLLVIVLGYLAKPEVKEHFGILPPPSI